MHETVIRVAPMLEGRIPRRTLLNAELSFSTWVLPGASGFESGYLIKLQSPTFHLEFGFDGQCAVLQRNGDTLKADLAPSPNAQNGACHIAVIWAPTRLSRGVNGVVSSVTTAPTFPPNALVDWARRQSVLPSTRFGSEHEFRDVVLNALDGLQDKISSTNMQNAFWDHEHSGRKIIGRKPKRETHVHPAIHGLLHDIALAKNLGVYPEAASGAGRLDFLVTGTLQSGSSVKACIEFKHAHSEDLLNGLTTQLPAYMRNHGTDNGFYCVTWFKGPGFDKPAEEMGAMRFRLIEAKTDMGLSDVGLIIIDLSAPMAPSRIGD